MSNLLIKPGPRVSTFNPLKKSEGYQFRMPEITETSLLARRNKQ